MTDEELIALLLDWNEHDEGKINDAREAAAARIEVLVNEAVLNKAAYEGVSSLLLSVQQDCIKEHQHTEELERACKEWAEVSQRNYQRAKAYYEALQRISAPTYGIQSIQEDYETDSIEYLRATHSYYYSLVTSYQAVARSAIAGVE